MFYNVYVQWKMLLPLQIVGVCRVLTFEEGFQEKIFSSFDYFETTYLVFRRTFIIELYRITLIV